MAIYYVRNDGSDLNDGTGYLSSQAFATITKAMQQCALNAAGGDIVYIAPGFYNETVTLLITPTSNYNNIVGDTFCAKFLDMSPGEVEISPANTKHTFAARAVTFDFDFKNYWSIRGLRLSAGSTATVLDIGTSVYMDDCIITGRLVGNTSSSQRTFSYNTYHACTIDGQDQIMYQQCIFTSLNVITAGNSFIESYVNLTGWYGNNSGYYTAFTGCVLNSYPTSTTGELITHSTNGMGTYIRGCKVSGVGKVLTGQGTTAPVMYLEGNEVHNVDLFANTKLNVASATTLDYNTFYNCFSCIMAEGTNTIPAANNNFIGCDVTAAGYINLGTTSVQAYGGRTTGTGNTGTLNYRLPYDSELTGVWISSATTISGYDYSLKIKGKRVAGPMQLFWIPVEAGVERTVTFKFKASKTLSMPCGFALGYLGVDTVTPTNSTAAEQTMVLSYTSFFTGYVPLLCYFGSTASISDSYVLISDITWT